MGTVLEIVISCSEKSGVAAASRVARRPAVEVSRNARAGRPARHGAKRRHRACRPFGLNDKQGPAAVIALWHQQEARTPGEGVQLVGKAVTAKFWIVAGKPAAIGRRG